jgi:hypothetical protein
VKEESRGLRGRTELTVRSRGPGTNTKCVRRVIRAYDAIRSANESKPSIYMRERENRKEKSIS